MRVETQKARLDTEFAGEVIDGTGAAEAAGAPNQALVRTTKHVVLRHDDSVTVDAGIVSPLLYNSFHYSLLPRQDGRAGFVIGVSSARNGDGKTLVAANLAASMALADERDTVLVDMNLRNPMLHSVFALNIGPGLAEALGAPMVHVARTTIRHLYVMTLGNIGATFSGLRHAAAAGAGSNGKRNGKGNGAADVGEMGGMPGFKHVLQGLKQRFGVVVLDLPSVHDPILPLNLTRQVDGMVIVVDSARTTRDDLAQAARRIGRERLLGLVLNRARDAA